MSCLHLRRTRDAVATDGNAEIADRIDAVGRRSCLTRTASPKVTKVTPAAGLASRRGVADHVLDLLVDDDLRAFEPPRRGTTAVGVLRLSEPTRPRVGAHICLADYVGPVHFSDRGLTACVLTENVGMSVAVEV